MPFNERLKRYRGMSNLTQKAVADALGVSLRGYQQYEQGKFEPNIEKLIILADLFQVSVDELVGHNFS